MYTYICIHTYVYIHRLHYISYHIIIYHITDICIYILIHTYYTLPVQDNLFFGWNNLEVLRDTYIIGVYENETCVFFDQMLLSPAQWWYQRRNKFFHHSQNWMKRARFQKNHMLTAEKPVNIPLKQSHAPQPHPLYPATAKVAAQRGAAYQPREWAGRGEAGEADSGGPSHYWYGYEPKL